MLLNSGSCSQCFEKPTLKSVRVWSKEGFMIEKVLTNKMEELMGLKPILLSGPGQGFARG